jgi:two-component system, NarL family, response regulator LiaR
MKRILLRYGLLGGLLTALLQLIDYRFLVLERSVEIYGGLVALLFSCLGIGLGLTLARRRSATAGTAGTAGVAAPAPAALAAGHEPFCPDVERQAALGITSRELQILELIAAGLSTREIAGRLFVSENTVKTHSARLFRKLSARRRTQAVHNAKRAGLIA